LSLLVARAHEMNDIAFLVTARVCDLGRCEIPPHENLMLTALFLDMRVFRRSSLPGLTTNVVCPASWASR
jgi:hypothetical protein